jgi:hypothetical protein
MRPAKSLADTIDGEACAIHPIGVDDSPTIKNQFWADHPLGQSPWIDGTELIPFGKDRYRLRLIGRDVGILNDLNVISKPIQLPLPTSFAERLPQII